MKNNKVKNYLNDWLQVLNPFVPTNPSSPTWLSFQKSWRRKSPDQNFFLVEGKVLENVTVFFISNFEPKTQFWPSEESKALFVLFIASSKVGYFWSNCVLISFRKLLRKFVIPWQPSNCKKNEEFNRELHCYTCLHRLDHMFWIVFGIIISLFVAVR